VRLARPIRRATGSVLALAIVPAYLAVPTLSRPVPAPRPVKPVVEQLPIGGVDRSALGSAARFGRDGTPRALRPDAGTATALRGLDDAPELFTAERATRPFTAVGVTWERGTTPAGTTVQVRTRTAGVWSGWEHLELSELPDPATPEGRSPRLRAGTEPLLTVGGSDGVQVRVDSADGRLPRGVRLELVDPGSSPADAFPGGSAPAASAYAEAGTPTILRRSAWGADESLRDGSPSMMSTIRAFAVHHSASTSGYTASGTAAQIRAIYAYSTRSEGYSDFPYSFVVDKFGRIWEGRAGGVDKPVRSGATGGFNDLTSSVGALGNFDTTVPSSAVVTAIARLGAWKLGLHRIDPLGSARLTARGASGTTSRYSSGTTVSVPTIFPHRQVGYTACPGRHLYAQMATIRSRAAAATGDALFGPAPSTRSAAAGGGATIGMSARVARAQSWALEIRPVCSPGTLTRRYTGTASRRTPIAASWDTRTSTGAYARAGAYTMRLTSGSARPYETTVVLRGTEPVPPVLTGTAPTVEAGGYRAVPALRVLGTTTGIGLARPLRAGGRVDVKVAGVGAVPAGATAVALTVSVPCTSAAGRVRVWPAGAAASDAQGLTTVPFSGTSHTVVVPVGVDGRVSVGNTAGEAELSVDVLGWFGAAVPTGLTLASGPVRVLETAAGLGGGVVLAGSTRSVAVTGGGVPTTAHSVLVRVAASRATGNGAVSVGASTGKPRSVEVRPGSTRSPR
jgi:hypothetical protein